MTISEQPPVKTVDLDVIAPQVPEIIKPEGLVLPATHRCDRCGSQAWVEVEAIFTRTTLYLTNEEGTMTTEDVTQPDVVTLLFCAHHYRDSETKVMEHAKRIVDYRETLEKQEKMGGPAL